MDPRRRRDIYLFLTFLLQYCLFVGEEAGAIECMLRSEDDLQELFISLLPSRGSRGSNSVNNLGGTCLCLLVAVQERHCL